MAEEWTGGEYVADLEGGGPAYVWTDSAGNKLATKDPNPPSTPAGLPAGTPIAPPVGGGQYYDPSMQAWITPQPGGGVVISKDKPTEPIPAVEPIASLAGPSAEPVEPVAESPEMFSVILPDGSAASVPVGAATININGRDYHITYSSDGTPNIVGAPAGTILSHLVPVGQPTAEQEQQYVHKYQIADLNPEAMDVLKREGIEGYNLYVEEARQLQEQSYEIQVQSFLSEVGGNLEYYQSLPDDKKQEYLEGFGWKPVEGITSGWQYDISGGETGARATAYLQAQEAFNEGRMPEPEFRQIESDWLGYVSLQEQKVLQTITPASPVQIERFINRYGGSVSQYNSLVDAEGNPDIDARNDYLDRVSDGFAATQRDILNEYNLQPDAEGNYPIYNLTNQDLQDSSLVSALTVMFGNEAVASVQEYADAKDTLAGLPDVPVYDESGDLIGYDYTKISKEQVTPAVVSAVALMTPDYDTATLG
ncbi:MAG: hypothetical protein WC479_12480, partial [Candidatus Izemoplasmatales bacterium]